MTFESMVASVLLAINALSWGNQQPISLSALFGLLPQRESEAGIVMEVMDDKSLPKAERKRLQVKTAGEKSREAKLIKAGGQNE